MNKNLLMFNPLHNGSSQNQLWIDLNPKFGYRLTDPQSGPENLKSPGQKNS